MRSLLTLFVLLFILSSCTGDYHGKPNKDFYNKPIQTLQDITLYRSKNGEVMAVLNASKVESYSGDNARTIFPKGLKVTFLNQDLTTKTILTAKYAISYDSTDVVYLKDSIKIVNLNTKDTIYCKDLYWQQDQKIVYTHRPIRRYSSSGQDFGDGLTANEVFDSVTIINPHGLQTIDDKDE